jgi:Na+-driven multidrug efflux pump/anti-sigma regulatory factor (Ser/Thr protein kinase)
MDPQAANGKTVTRLLFRLLPAQILLCAVGAVNGIVSSFFATNYVGVAAMGAVGVYSPLHMLITSISTVLVGGSAVLCGKYIGQNRQREMQNVFSLTLAVSLLIALALILLYVPVGLLDLSGFLTRDPAVRPLFNRYLLGQAIGVVPLMLGNSFAAFLSLENKGRRTLIASLSYIAANLVLNYVFVQLLQLEAFGLALASSLGMWVFLGVQAQVFLSGKSQFRVSFRDLSWRETGNIVHIGLHGAISNLYQTARGLIVNHLLEVFVGSVAISAFSAANHLLGLVWAIPGGMLAVSRLIISVSAGEEDRQTLTDVMRGMFTRFLPLMCVVSASVILCAVPLTRLFYQDPGQPVFMMTVWGFRILPLCMPLSVICMHFSCYAHIMGRHTFVHVLALLDGVLCVALFTAALIPSVGMNSVYIANVLNGVVTTLVIAGYACVKNRRLPRTMDELMVIPPTFGVPPEDRLDFSVRSMEDVVTVAERIQRFCLAAGVNRSRAMLAALCMEEMAANVVSHGFSKDRRSHSVDIRVLRKEGDLILRIKDDCVPFDPGERRAMADPRDPLKNVGIRTVFRAASDVQYQNILGLNVLTIRIAV